MPFLMSFCISFCAIFNHHAIPLHMTHGNINLHVWLCSNTFIPSFLGDKTGFFCPFLWTFYCHCLHACVVCMHCNASSHNDQVHFHECFCLSHFKQMFFREMKSFPMFNLVSFFFVINDWTLMIPQVNMVISLLKPFSENRLRKFIFLEVQKNFHRHYGHDDDGKFWNF